MKRRLFNFLDSSLVLAGVALYMQLGTVYASTKTIEVFFTENGIGRSLLQLRQETSFTTDFWKAVNNNNNNNTKSNDRQLQSSTQSPLDFGPGSDPTCPICGEVDYTCNSGTLSTDWNDGIRQFTDPLPNGSCLLGIDFEVYGICDNNNPVELILNGKSLGPTDDGFVRTSCQCNECDTANLSVVDGQVDSYLYGQTNSLQIARTSTIPGGGLNGICIHEVIMTFTYGAGTCAPSAAPSMAPSISNSPTKTPEVDDCVTSDGSFDCKKNKVEVCVSKVKRSKKGGGKGSRYLDMEDDDDTKSSSSSQQQQKVERVLKPKSSRLPSIPTFSPTNYPTYVDYDTKCVDPKKGVDLTKYTVENCGPCE